MLYSKVLFFVLLTGVLSYHAPSRPLETSEDDIDGLLDNNEVDISNDEEVDDNDDELPEEEEEEDEDEDEDDEREEDNDDDDDEDEDKDYEDVADFINNEILKEETVEDNKKNKSFCTGKKNGNYPSKKCGMFITCAHGYTHKRSCPGGLSYDAKTDRCNYPLCKGKGFCVGKNDGNFADPKRCSGYISCSNGVAYRQKCQNNLHFNATSNQCDHKDKSPCKETCEVDGKFYKSSDRFIWRCTHSCICKGPNHTCEPLCPRTHRNCGPNGKTKSVTTQVTTNPTCFCTKSICITK
ncbi:PHD finger protein 14-like [Hydractinia symbiolongicarpus]|uniref:PHD finger protein 14-like n=1 Tax=Hydractinia symbiolongicarpus TaxID=13093 RepID=UPI00255139CD|nr:PHD finger protein 14-like [Hydractinia symbiolongicarpus]XP_057293236.1 PHD finger protein 14-like [Hydractinia symbiolongicarpus]